MQIKINELEKILAVYIGEIGVEVDMTNKPTMKKTGNPYKDVDITKDISYKGTIGRKYSEELAKQNDGTPAKARAWGTFVNNYLISHKGSLYVQVFVESSSNPIYRVNGVEIDESNVKPWLQERSADTSPIVIRDIKFENIKNIKLTMFRGSAFERVESYEIIS